jgi:hypothetical protein
MVSGDGLGVEGSSRRVQPGASRPVVERPKKRYTENAVIWIQAPPFKKAGKRYGIKFRTWNSTFDCEMTEFTLCNRKTFFTEVMSTIKLRSYSQGRRLMRFATRIVAEVHMVNGANDVCLMNVGYGRIKGLATPTAAMLVVFSHVPISIRFTIIDLEGLKKACEAVCNAQAAQQMVSDVMLMQ